MFFLFLLLLLPLGVFALQNSVNYLIQAQTPPQVNASFSPTQVTVPSEKTVKIMLDSKTKNVAFAKVVFNFDKTKVKLTSEITTTSSLSTTVQKSTMTQANTEGKATIVIAAAPTDTKPSGIFEYATFKIDAVSGATGGSDVNFIPAEMQIVDINSATLTVVPANLAVNKQNTGNPTGTPASQVTIPAPNSNPSTSCNTVGSTTCLNQWIREFTGTEATKYSDKTGDGKVDLQDFEKIRKALLP